MRTHAPLLAALLLVSTLAPPSAPHEQGPTAPPSPASSNAFTQNGVGLLSWLPLAEYGPGITSANDCWGYTSPAGREYAVLGLSSATAFVEVSDPSEASVIQVLPGPSHIIRDVKVFGACAYSSSEGGGGVQVFDLAQIDAGVVTALGAFNGGGATTRTHNLAIDETSAFLYRCGGENEGLRAYSLANAKSPSFVGSWSDRYVHDAEVVTYTSGPFQGRQIAFACTGFNGGFDQPGIDVIDVTSKASMVSLKRAFYPGAVFAHQCWLSDDRRYLYVNDELDELTGLPTTTHVIDVSDVNKPTYVTSFDNNNPAIGHNLYVKGNLILEANYRSGLRVFDATNPLAPFEQAFFDTFPDDDAPAFDGLWSTYPYFPSGTVIGSDIQRGLFVWRLGNPKLLFDLHGGVPELVDPDGDSLDVHIHEDTPGDLVPGSARVHVDFAGASLEVALVDLGGGDFRADLPSIPCGLAATLYLSAQSTDGLVWRGPLGAPAAVFHVTAAKGELVALADDIESDLGWVAGAPGDDASSGLWTRGDPIGTSAQPSEDHTPGAGALCWFTGQGSPGGSAGENDVDGGRTTLVTPVLDLASSGDPLIGYWRWYSNSAGSAPASDVFVVEVTNDGGTTWSLVETVGPGGAEAQGGWYRHELRLRDVVAPTSAVRLRFVASDAGDGSVVEAAIDDFDVRELVCPDCDGNGVSDGLDIVGGAALDLDGDGVPDRCQPLSADAASVSLASGGTQSFTLDAGVAFAGQVYLLLGTTSGTSPGVALGALTLPLNPDAYTNLTLASPNGFPLASSLGFLDGAGRGAARFSLPPGANPALVGIVAHHAYPLLDPLGGGITLVSNAIPLVLVP